MGCAFCEERAIPLSKLRAPERLAHILQETQYDYGGSEIRPYFESSFFLPSLRWATELRSAMERRNIHVQWRCETRVDGMKPATVAELAASGLKVLDLGLETASATQIKAMNKSRDPERYLRMASMLLEACERNGIWVKVNVLLYGGETAKTLAETQGWLDRHASAIKGVSVGPVVAYGPPIQSSSFLNELMELGARPVDPGSAETSGITQLHLSPEIDSDTAEQFSLALSRRYMGMDDYFDLKHFSYYPREYTKSNFLQDLGASEAERLPFRPAIARAPNNV
jgi:hypothetical protein